MAKAAKNPWGKSRDKEKPYFTLTYGGWEWRVTKANGDPRKPYASMFCWVKSPATMGTWDWGDTYIGEIGPNGGVEVVAAWMKAKEESDAGRTSNPVGGVA